ncbi:MAG: tRNA pseudouridine(55) synthase TruB, partial [Alphaproteobacteria bacterium]|nr:tRNA pseudouridine(55) synthase TruB [Alphaproteobacteria bacterium]
KMSEKKDITGWLVLDKPLGMSSAQAVGKVKHLLHPKKIGHAGTLDPLASGVLPLALGKATRTVSYVMDGHKKYRFEITFGKATTTDDAEGEIIKTSSKLPTEEEIRQILPQFTGK